MPRTAKKASTTQMIAINDILREAITKDEATGLVSYKGEFSDVSIAEKIGVSIHSVSRIRVEMHGKLMPAPKSSEIDDARFALIEKQLSELRVKYHKLICTLALKQVADVRHLSLVDFDKEGKPIG